MKLNRNKLRKIILNEIKRLNENIEDVIEHNGKRYKLSYVTDSHGDTLYDIFDIDLMQIVGRITSPAGERDATLLRRTRAAIDQAGAAPMYGYSSGKVPRY